MCIFIKKSLVQKEIHMKKIIFTLTVFLMFAQLMQGQVLISLLLGDKLNSEKLKFGLDGGANFSTITNAGATKYNTGFDLGFYFDFLLKKDKPWYVHTGVSPYHLTNADSTALDTLFANGGVERNLRYFNVPVLVRYKFKFDMFVELGIMMGLMYKAYDEFYTEIDNKKDLTFQNDVRDLYKRFDVGGMAGIGYHFSKGTGTDIGFRYYYGFMDMLKDNPGLAQRNSAFYLYVAIPIGAGEKAKAKQAESKKKKAAKKAEKEAKEKN
jgi:hypothetical protein